MGKFEETREKVILEREQNKKENKKKTEKFILEIFNVIGFLCLISFSTLGLYVLTYKDYYNPLIGIPISVMYSLLFFFALSVNKL